MPGRSLIKVICLRSKIRIQVILKNLNFAFKDILDIKYAGSIIFFNIYNRDIRILAI